MRNLVSRHKIDVQKTNAMGENALDLIFEHYLSRKQTIKNQSADQQQLLLPIIKYLVENGIEIETDSYGNRPNPLYFLLENYTGTDMLDIVEYFVNEKKIAFKREEALAKLRRRQFNVSKKSKIERVLLRAGY